MHRSIVLVLTALAAACGGRDAKTDEAVLAALRNRELRPLSPEWHRGPPVDVAPTGPARFTAALLAAFDTERAMATARSLDRHYREPANDGYEQALDELEGVLRGAGFGSDPRLELAWLVEPEPVEAWTPLGARLTLLEAGRPERVLLEFVEPGDASRVMLPTGAPACALEAGIALSMEELDPGEVLVTAAPLRQVLPRVARTAAALVSASLETFNVDPHGGERHRDAIQYTDVPPDTALPCFQISPRVLAEIEQARARDPGARLRLSAEVERSLRPLRTLCATIVGARDPLEAVAMVSHVQEPGACDNASGVAGLLESARSVAGLLASGALEWPARSLVFLWGDEFRQSRVWLDQGGRNALAGLSSDMTGESFERTGAILLLERSKDPGALAPLPPDQHTPWGAGRVVESDLVPNGLAVVARCAMIDVGLAAGGWRSADHPWEGGSDHDVFLERGLPAVLFWHFTDFAYHTSLDRMENVDPAELARTAVVLLSTGLAVADARPDDLERYLYSLQAEERVRVDAARAAGNAEVEAAWKDWCRGARMWLRRMCLVTADEPPTPDAAPAAPAAPAADAAADSQSGTPPAAPAPGGP